jgi:SAM-dependent methyltransferase
MYYQNKLISLQDLFGTQDIVLEPNWLIVGAQRYPIINDVIILSPPEQYTETLKKALALTNTDNHITTNAFAPDIQYTFGAEWQNYNQIMPEHRNEFDRYFDIVNPETLRNRRVCDLGCGNGRWSYFLKDIAREIIMVDFSDAIFTARQNLAGNNNCLFFMCDLKQLPFRNNFADFLFCLGVLHHLPTPCLEETRRLKSWAPELLIFLYYALDNRPLHFRILLKIVTVCRLIICKIRSNLLRKLIVQLGTWLIYMPLILFGRLLKPLGLSRYVPLYEAYHNKTIRRIKQDVYDRFFTRIEQRVSRADILGLKDTFSQVTVSEQFPYWHFICRR